MVGSYIPSLIEFGLSMTLLFGYGGWHVFLKFKRRETIGHVVWVVCACMFANAVSALIISLGDKFPFCSLFSLFFIGVFFRPLQRAPECVDRLWHDCLLHVALFSNFSSCKRFVCALSNLV